LGLKLMLIICHEISIQRADELNEKWDSEILNKRLVNQEPVITNIRT
jgi:GTPase SAR1 family protein